MKKASPLLLVSFLLFTLSNLQAAPQCPGDAASVRYHSLDRSQIAIPVTINGTGPYEFMVDTGSQLTIIDPELASELRLQPLSSIGILAVTSFSQAQLVTPDDVQAGTHSVTRLLVAVRSFADVHQIYPRLRGILGENFLARFDLLIDYSQRLLCLDESSRMRKELQGEHVALEVQAEHESDLPFTQPYLVSVHLAGSGNQPTIMRVDSGANTPVIYNDVIGAPCWVRGNAVREGHWAGDTPQTFRALAPEDIRIGTRWLRQVVFVTPGNFGAKGLKPGLDGLLPTGLFHRVLLSYSEHFAMFDPK